MRATVMFGPGSKSWSSPEVRAAMSEYLAQRRKGAKKSNHPSLETVALASTLLRA